MNIEQGVTELTYREERDDWSVYSTHSDHIDKLLELYTEEQFEAISKDNEGIPQAVIIHGLGDEVIEFSKKSK